MLDEVATIRGRNAFLDLPNEPLVIVEQTLYSFLNQHSASRPCSAAARSSFAWTSGEKCTFMSLVWMSRGLLSITSIRQNLGHVLTRIASNTVRGDHSAGQKYSGLITENPSSRATSQSTVSAATK